MSTSFPLPRIEEIRNTFGMLFGEGVKIEKVDEADTTRFIGLFIDDDVEPVAAFTSDLPFTCFAGAALSMIPVNGAEDALTSDEPTEMMEANLHEIINIGSRWFMDASSPHLRLDAVYELDDLPDDAEDLLKTPAAEHFHVSIPNYGAGSFSCIST